TGFLLAKTKPGANGLLLQIPCVRKLFASQSCHAACCLPIEFSFQATKKRNPLPFSALLVRSLCPGNDRQYANRKVECHPANQKFSPSRLAVLHHFQSRTSSPGPIDNRLLLWSSLLMRGP